MDIFMIAGEASGDLHGSHLLKALPPHLKVGGVGGPRMRAVGFETVMPMEQFQVMGFVDVMAALPRLWKQFNEIKQAILKIAPPVLVTIDYPGFNLRLARALKKAGFRGKICHYICPSVWAWGKGRIDLIAKNFDLLLTILPFETACFQNTSLKTEYVGHPLIREIPEELHRRDENLIAIFPGSRRKEIERNFPIYLAVVSRLQREYPKLRFVVSAANEDVRPLLKTDLPLTTDTTALMKQAGIAVAKSGTVTLELALHGVPTVVTYGISRLDAFLAQHIFRIRLPHYCLVNIIAGKEVFPELIGPALTEETLYAALIRLIEDQKARLSCMEECRNVRTLLGPQNASQKAAETLQQFF